MGWVGRLALAYRSEPWRDGAQRTVLHPRHEGPLRVLARLYPESPCVCHNVLVHPPGGIVGGDTLHIDAELADQYLVMERGDIVQRGRGADMAADGARQRVSI